MPITGGFSRTAINVKSGVKSPIPKLVTSTYILLSIYKLARAFYWIPKASSQQSSSQPAKVFHSTVILSSDFIPSMVSFWVSTFVSVKIGIAAGVRFTLVYMLLRIAFAGITHVTTDNLSTLYSFSKFGEVQAALPKGTQIFKLHASLLFPNSNRVKKNILDTVFKYNSDAPTASVCEKDRLWNARGDKSILALRAKS
jgi:MFS superfamily sulfate permease-like transporter